MRDSATGIDPRSSVLLLSLLALVAAGGCSPAGSEGGVERVILISIDTLRPDFLTPYKPDLDTSPEIARLASEGSLFLDVLAQAPSTARSHKSILYSLYPAIHKTRPRRVPQERIESPLEMLQQAGYLTAALVGGGQLHPLYGFAKGFDSYEVIREQVDAETLSALEKAVLGWLAEHRHDRFFLFLHTYQVHAPYAPPAEYWSRYAGWYRGDLDPSDMRRARDFKRADLEEEEVRFLRDLYAGEVAYVDAFLGRLFRALRELDIYETTMIVFLSDHGESLGERARFGHNQLYDVQLRIPLIIRVPGLPPSRIGEPVEAIDVMPTIFAALQLSPPFEFQGGSLLPLMRGTSEAWGKEYRIAQHGQRVAVQRGTWKLKHRLDGIRADRLYNLATDPNEEENLAASFPDIVDDLRSHFEQTTAAAAELASLFTTEEATDPSQDEEVRRQLKALGYLE